MGHAIRDQVLAVTNCFYHVPYPHRNPKLTVLFTLLLVLRGEIPR